MSALKLEPLKFTTCHRITVYTYTHTTFTEEDFLKTLSEEQRLRWTTLPQSKRADLWAELHSKFPFDLGTHKEFDPHTNWIEAWDTEEIHEETAAHDSHPYVKEEIQNSVKNICKKF